MKSRRAARVECLERRRTLSAAAAPTAPQLTDGVLTINGTSDPDLIRVDIVAGDVVRVDFDGLRYDYPAADVESVNIQASGAPRGPLDSVTLGPGLARPVLAGTDRLFIESPETDNNFTVGDFTLTGGGKSVTFGTGFVSLSGGGGNDTFTINQRYEVGRQGMAFHGGAGVDAFVVREAAQATVVYGDSGDDSLDMSSAVPTAFLKFDGGPGFDRLSSDGTPFGDSVGVINGAVSLPASRLVHPTDVELLRLSLGDGDDFATITDSPNRFSRIEVDAGAGDDSLTFAPSVAVTDDAVSLTPGMVRGLGADVAHAGFETLKVDTGTGSDVIDYDVPDPAQPLATVGTTYSGTHDVINIRHGVFARPVRIFNATQNATLVIHPGATADVDAQSVQDIAFNGTEGDDDIELLVGARTIQGAGSRISFGFSQPTVTINGLGGADRISSGNSGLGGLSVDAGPGNDAVRVGYGTLEFGVPVNVGGGGGDDSLLIDATTTYTEGLTFALGGHGLGAFGNSGGAGVPVAFGAFEDVTFDEGYKGATVVVTPDTATTFHVRGNDPAPAPGIDILDRIEIDERGVTGKTFTATGPGAGTFTFTNRRPVDFTGMESVGNGIPPARVTGRSLFYNNSALDGHNAAATADDALAIVPRRTPLFPGEDPVQENVSDYSRGINGLFVDFTGVPPEALSAADFEFRVGTGGDSGAWPLAPAPASVTTIPGPLGANGARYAITWPDGAIRNTWLRVTVKAGARTGLARPDVFFFGNLVGWNGGTAPFTVTPGHYVAARQAAARGGRFYNSFYDFDHNGRVDAADLAAVRRSIGHSLTTPTVPPQPAAAAALPPAPGAALAPPRRRSNWVF